METRLSKNRPYHHHTIFLPTCKDTTDGDPGTNSRDSVYLAERKLFITTDTELNDIAAKRQKIICRPQAV